MRYNGVFISRTCFPDGLDLALQKHIHTLFFFHLFNFCLNNVYMFVQNIEARRF